MLLPLSVDGRSREFVVVRPVLSERAMTAWPAPLPDTLLDGRSTAILALPEVSGVGLDISSKPPATIELE